MKQNIAAMGGFKSKIIRVNGNRHEVAVVVNTENQNNVSRKKVGQKLVTRQNENPEHVAGKAVPGFWISLSATSIVAAPHRGACSFSVENDADEISRTAGRQCHSHSMLAGGLVVTSRTTRLAWGTSLTMRAETRAMRS